MSRDTPDHVNALYQRQRPLPSSLFLKFPAILWRIRQHQRFTQDEITRHQNKRLQTMIRHCYDHVPFYHAQFKEANVHPEDIQTVQDLHRIPLTTKEDLVTHPSTHLTADNIDLNRCWAQSTSGSTGTRLSIYWVKEAKLESSYLGHYIHQLACGDKITHRRVSVAGFTPAPPTFLQKLGIFPTKIVSPFDALPDQLNHIQAFDPSTLLGTPSCLLQLAKEVRSQGNQVNVFHISLIFTGGELLDDQTRSYLMDTFTAKVYDAYGAAETGTIGHECPEGRLHVDTHSTVLEITKDGELVAPGEEGEITVTSLYNYAQPFIRYNLKDMGFLVTEPCPCRKQSMVLEITQGRKMDMIYRPDTNPIPVNEVCAPLTFLDGIRQFQILQDAIDTVTVKIVPDVGFTDARYAATRRLVQQCLGKAMTLNLELVKAIPREPSGKLPRFKTRLR